MIFGFLAFVATMFAVYYAFSRFDIFIKGVWRSFLGLLAGGLAFFVFGQIMTDILHIDFYDADWLAPVVFIFMIVGVIGAIVLYGIELRKKGYMIRDIIFSSSSGIALTLLLIMFAWYSTL